MLQRTPAPSTSARKVSSPRMICTDLISSDRRMRPPARSTWRRLPGPSESWLTSSLSMRRTSVLFDWSVATAMSRSNPSPCAALAGSMLISRIVPPGQGSNAAGRTASLSAAVRLADHHGDIALRPVLVAAIALVGRHYLWPERRLFLRRGGAGPQRTRDPGDRDLDAGIRRQVSVPLRIAVVPALRGHQDYPVIVL